MEKKYIGVDVGGTTVKIGIFTAAGELLYKWEVPTRKEHGGAYILEDVADSIRNTLKEHSIEMAEIAGAGIGVPGPVMPDGHVDVCVNLGWRDINPAQELSALLDGIPVKCENDANVAALGEMWQGGGKGYRDILMITLGTGVGGGLIMNGRIVSGNHGCAGEIGHIHVRDEEKERCNCGGYGCVEQVASATGIAREARRQMAACDMPSTLRGFGDAVTAKDVLDAAKADDKLALEVVETMANYLGRMMSCVSMVVDPQAFVIGGGVSKAGQFLADVVEKYYKQYLVISKEKADICLARLGNDAGIYGAAKMVLDI